MKRNFVLTAVLGLLVTGAAAFAMHPGGPFGIERLEAFSKLPADKQALVISTLSAVRMRTRGSGAR
jgi:hypothetical protein